MWNAYGSSLEWKAQHWFWSEPTSQYYSTGAWGTKPMYQQNQWNCNKCMMLATSSCIQRSQVFIYSLGGELINTIKK